MMVIRQLDGYLTDLRNGNSVQVGALMILPKGNDRFELWKGSTHLTTFIGARDALLHAVNTQVKA